MSLEKEMNFQPCITIQFYLHKINKLHEGDLKCTVLWFLLFST